MFPVDPITDRGDGRTAPLIPAIPAPEVSYGSDDNNSEPSSRLCRICLEGDHPHDLIAPCRCKGSSKWVHRDCLDLWRTHEQDRAFGRCTECQFVYRYEQQPAAAELDRRTRFCLFVSRDVCLVTVLLQVVIGIMGLIIYGIVNMGNNDWNFVCPRSSYSSSAAGTDDDDQNTYYYDSNNEQSFGCRHEFFSFYLLGLFGLLVCMGLFGSIFLCGNGCRVPDLTSTGVQDTADEHTTQQPDMTTERQQQRSQFYNNQRQRRVRRRERDSCDNCIDCVYCCDVCCNPRYGGRGNCFPYYYYYGGPGYYNDDSCCSCCCQSSHHAAHSSSSTGGDCCCLDIGGGSSSSGGSNNDNCGDAAHILLLLLLIAAIIMAIIGVFVGVFVGVVLAQRIVQRHMFLLQKRRLVDEFRVADLSKTAGYSVANVELGEQHRQEQPPSDVDAGLVKPTAPMESMLPVYHISPSAPPEAEVLNAENEQHLRKLGLLE